MFRHTVGAWLRPVSDGLDRHPPPATEPEVSVLPFVA